MSGLRVALGVDYMFLVGAWWGEGIAADAAMRPAVSVLQYDRGQAHESQWRMLAPGPESSRPIREKIAALCARYDPSGICLTHARFKHAADVNGMFEVGEGPLADAMRGAGIRPGDFSTSLNAVDERLRGMSGGEARELASGKRLVEFPDALGSTDFFSRWFTLRCRHVAEAVQSVFSPARQSHPNVRLGTNAVGPMFSRLSGHDFELLAPVCDFIQPLLGYMRWHVLQPVYMWARFIRNSAPRCDSATALSISADLFGFSPSELALDWADRDGDTEGRDDAVLAMVARQLRSLPQSADVDFMPVLRGQGIPRKTIYALREQAAAAGYRTLIHQGSDFLEGRAPHEGWRQVPSPAAPRVSAGLVPAAPQLSSYGRRLRRGEPDGEPFRFAAWCSRPVVIPPGRARRKWAGIGVVRARFAHPTV